MPVGTNFSFIIEVDRCPMYFNDGTNPWDVAENHIRVFDFSGDEYNHASTKLILGQSAFVIISLLHILSRML